MHALWVTYTGEETAGCSFGERYGVVGVTQSGGVWVIGKTMTIVPIERMDYVINTVIYAEPKEPQVIQPSQDEKVADREPDEERAAPYPRQRIKRPRGV